MFVTHKFDKGGTYFGVGPVGVVAGLAATAISHQRAKGRRAERILVGQARHEWVTGVELHRARWFRGWLSYVHVVARTLDGEQRIEFRAAPDVNHDWATWLAAPWWETRALCDDGGADAAGAEPHWVTPQSFRGRAQPNRH